MPSIRFSKDSKIPVFVLRKLGVESLKQPPNIWRRRQSRVHVIVSVGEAGCDGLVNIQHISILIEAVRVQSWSCCVDIGEIAWAIFLPRSISTWSKLERQMGGKYLEQANHG